MHDIGIFCFSLQHTAHKTIFRPGAKNSNGFVARHHIFSHIFLWAEREPEFEGNPYLFDFLYFQTLFTLLRFAF